jgi:hypothetical protein
MCKMYIDSAVSSFMGANVKPEMALLVHSNICAFECILKNCLSSLYLSNMEYLIQVTT